MTDNRRFSPPAVGGISLLSVFAVLCLTVFALLSLSTVQADKRLEEKSAQAVIDYYDADCRAQKLLAQIRSGKIPDGVYKKGDIYEYHCPVGDTQRLNVSVKVNGENWKILKWQVVNIGEWTPDDRLNVWNGNAEPEN